MSLVEQLAEALMALTTFPESDYRGLCWCEDRNLRTRDPKSPHSEGCQKAREAIAGFRRHTPEGDD